ncbi:ornithine carbamoyltransferase [Salisediminibacterium beveridgei]|uniref:Ornithine carbamoyltransferase n=1 Tax=Salisediminibacterium beveridgei TaxID=632773 RepID=A0A1D7QVF0_9BACI|nr:ornithine carbamoyltransferase [Salisediminibacterium beveridgei]AOM82982.1 Ornithine carbamoyltransferase [Salisediminibacterium beveridgei]
MTTPKHFLTMLDYDKEMIQALLEDAKQLKKELKEGTPHPHLKGKTLAMIFEKSSTRTRVSFEVGMLQLGGHALFLSSNEIQLGRGEPISDTAKVLSGYVDGIMIRTFGHSRIEELADQATIPVINGLTNEHHPCQVMADLLTIQEQKGTLEGLTASYIGDGFNNVAHSLIQGLCLMGMHVKVASPEGYEPDPAIMHEAEVIAGEQGGSLAFSHSAQTAIQDSDVVITDVWASMGNEAEKEQRLNDFQGFQVNQELTEHAKDDYIFLHCLPAHRGEEVTSEIIDGSHSVVFEEAENRLHAQKAILKKLL